MEEEGGDGSEGEEDVVIEMMLLGRNPVECQSRLEKRTWCIAIHYIAELPWGTFLGHTRTLARALCYNFPSRITESRFAKLDINAAV